ncbi:MAG TPA: SAM-dependent chlorinase/fluorinase [Dehalococcoidia bacterium]|jgi:S-adenosylmethionine hydrolase|nr:SAM-dependent chlorinase/fluorinase [Dehalococcoidia bacterium]
MPPIVSFTSDFGTADPYVAAVKAVILSRAPEATIVDVTHEVRPQAVAQGCFLAQQAWPFFPPGTVHLVVVDPGVGTERAAVALHTPHGYVVGPDNGVLSAALPAQSRAMLPPPPSPEKGTAERALPLTLPAGFEARLITSDRIVRPGASFTFHGRDVFGPAAGYLAAGGDFAAIGPAVERVLALPLFQATLDAEGCIGRIVHVDRFGNLITCIRGDRDLPATGFAVEVLGQRVPFVRTYGEGSGLVALIGSSRFLEVAFVNGSAARETGLGVGDLVRVRRL